MSCSRQAVIQDCCCGFGLSLPLGKMVFEYQCTWIAAESNPTTLPATSVHIDPDANYLLNISPDDTDLAVTQQDQGQLTVFSLNNKRAPIIIQLCRTAWNCATFVHGKRLVVVYSRGKHKIQLLDLNRLSPSETVCRDLNLLSATQSTELSVHTVQYDASERVVLLCASHHVVFINEQLQLVRKFDIANHHVGMNSMTSNIIPHIGKRQICYVNQNNIYRVSVTEDGKNVPVLIQRTSFPRSMAIFDDLLYVQGAESDSQKEVSVYDLAAAKLIKVLTMPFPVHQLLAAGSRLFIVADDGIHKNQFLHELHSWCMSNR